MVALDAAGSRSAMAVAIHKYWIIRFRLSRGCNFDEHLFTPSKHADATQASRILTLVLDALRTPPSRPT